MHGKEECWFYCKTSQVLQGIHHCCSISKSLDAMRVNQTDVTMLNIPRIFLRVSMCICYSWQTSLEGKMQVQKHHICIVSKNSLK